MLLAEGAKRGTAAFRAGNPLAEGVRSPVAKVLEYVRREKLQQQSTSSGRGIQGLVLGWVSRGDGFPGSEHWRDSSVIAEECKLIRMASRVAAATQLA